MNQKRSIALFVIAVITLILCLLIWIPVFLWIITVSITRGKVSKDTSRQNKLDKMISWCESLVQSSKSSYVDATVTKTTTSSSKTTSTMFDSFTSWVKSIIKWGAIIVLARIIIGSAYFIVQPGQVAFLVRFGTIQPGNYTPWLYFKVPFIDKKVVMNTQIQKSEVTANSASSDLQDVSAQVALNYAVDTNSAKVLFQTVWTEEEVSSRLISPGIQEAVKAATAKYVASQLITDRVKVKSDMLTALKEKLEPRWIKIVDLNIVDFKFSEAFNQAVESKVRAEQDALAQKNKLEQVKYESQQQIEKSKAEAEKIKIQAEAITKQWWKEYVQLQRIAKRDGQLPKISSEGNWMLLNVDSLSK
jgi:regulator of protease activity HflC (stomatin/prohibitin superfamily)